VTGEVVPASTDESVTCGDPSRVMLVNVGTRGALTGVMLLP
jgi:hypothetical protein